MPSALSLAGLYTLLPHNVLSEVHGGPDKQASIGFWDLWYIYLTRPALYVVTSSPLVTFRHSMAAPCPHISLYGLAWHRILRPKSAIPSPNTTPGT
ncbi:hypothetical protein BOTBODRAFT_32354 [Botryobasidium botryosum FD-172 SS1]|uniref:Uncharacterized protein n=1 Tax=Botryobasidium botryosum (strain FD-172 SS1) TaxID=930990 RepID=A0A067MFL6_BOTB1|nr:hypothetical protein BOTBODRAFT_32354 [Botryobasidium botryosum FD-172 SS1]